MPDKKEADPSVPSEGKVRLRTSGFVDNFVIPVKNGEDVVVKPEFQSFLQGTADKIKKAAEARRIKIVEDK